MSTITTVSEDALMAAAGKLQCSGAGTGYGFIAFGFRKMV